MTLAGAQIPTTYLLDAGTEMGWRPRSVTQDFLDRFNRESFIGGAVVVQSIAPRFWTHVK